MGGDGLYTQFDGVFFEKTRLSILTILQKEETAFFGRIKELIGGTDGAVFTHLQKLQEAGYISQKKEIAGARVQTRYALTKAGEKELARYLNFVAALLSGDR